MSDIIIDADGEMVLGFRFAEFIQHGFDHGWREFLGRQTVTTTNCLDARLAALYERIDDVQVERLTQ